MLFCGFHELQVGKRSHKERRQIGGVQIPVKTLALDLAFLVWGVVPSTGNVLRNCLDGEIPPDEINQRASNRSFSLGRISDPSRK